MPISPQHVIGSFDVTDPGVTSMQVPSQKFTELPEGWTVQPHWEMPWPPGLFKALSNPYLQICAHVNYARVFISSAPIDHCILLIVNEGCHRFRILLPSASSVPLNTPLDLEILRGYPFSNVDLVVQSVAGVIYPVDVQSLVIQSIVAIVIGIDVMKIPSMHGHWYRVVRDHGTRAQWGHHQCNSGWNQLSCRGSLYLEVLAWCLRFRYLFFVLGRPVRWGTRDSLQLSSTQVFRVFQICIIWVRFFPLNNYLLIQFELVLGLPRYRVPHRTYLWFRAGRPGHRTWLCLNLKMFGVCQIQYR